MTNDCKNIGGDDFLKIYCGIDLDNTDTGAITGADAGGSFTKAVFSSNKLTLTIKGGGSLTCQNVTVATAFNINGSNYGVSGKTIVRN